MKNDLKRLLEITAVYNITALIFLLVRDFAIEFSPILLASLEYSIFLLYLLTIAIFDSEIFLKNL